MILSLFANPIIILLTASIIVMSLMFLFVGRKKKTKNKKVEKVFDKKEEKNESNTDESKKDSEEIKTEIKSDEELKQIEGFDYIEEDDNDKSSSKKVTKVFVKKPELKKVDMTKYDENQKYEDLSNRAKFIYSDS